MFASEETLRRIGGFRAAGVVAGALVVIGGGVGWIETHPAQAAAPVPEGVTVDPPAGLFD